jgi:hypothetical protein
MNELFDNATMAAPLREDLAAGAVLLRDRAFSRDDILAALARVVAQAPQ